MRFVSFHNALDRRTRFGLRVGESHVIDVEGATYARLSSKIPSAKAIEIARALTPSEAVKFISGGDLALTAARETLLFALEIVGKKKLIKGSDGAEALFKISDIVLDPPVPNPGKFIAAGKNFVEHLAEMTNLANPERPVGFAQMSTTFLGPDKTISIPSETVNLDYEVEVGIIIGKPAYMVSPETAMNHVFGYTIFNDLSARDMYRNEQKIGIPLLGKNLENFGPMGPHIVTSDEFDDPTSLKLSMRVNGEVRQKSTLKSMLFGIAELVSWWSRIGLDPGDIISSGTPSGVAAGRKSSETPWWLKAGDVCEAEVEGIGSLRTIFK